ncbi:hypothetical protein [Clostridium beijerinckii]|uniref:hypothetical protein n=1 Tax=Clostridium beijerinckii TaxID=1520 RepID=UPI00047A6357|nr:hypothetical protein [Clostridium beijerinckii]
MINYEVGIKNELRQVTMKRLKPIYSLLVVDIVMCTGVISISAYSTVKKQQYRGGELSRDN